MGWVGGGAFPKNTYSRDMLSTDSCLLISSISSCVSSLGTNRWDGVGLGDFSGITWFSGGTEAGWVVANRV